MNTELMSTRRTRKVGLTKGCAFGIGSCAQKKRLVCSKRDDQNLLKFAHHLPLGPSMCGENIKMNRGSGSDKSRINEYMSD